MPAWRADFTADPDVQTRRPRSVLVCSRDPLHKSRSQLIGVVYLENNLPSPDAHPQRP